ncbi:MAG: hypothetical protein AAFY52_12900, partial [Pseudomonadota bacterium]
DGLTEKKSRKRSLKRDFDHVAKTALAVLTVSDHLQTGEALPSEDRERSFGDMVEIALEAAFA